MDAAAKAALAPEDAASAASDLRPLTEHRHEDAHGETTKPEEHDPWAKVKALALKHLDRFMSLDPKVLRGEDPEAIHDLRVASRRLQQVLDLLYPAPRHGEIRKLRRKIRRSRRALGDVRNADVQLERVNEILSRKRSTRREAWQAFRDYLVARRSDHFAKAVRKLTKQNLAVFYVRLKHLLTHDDPHKAAHASHHLMGSEEAGSESFEDRMTRTLAGVWGAFEGQVAESHRDSRMSVIHGVRVAAKRLRYLVEVLRELETPGCAETLGWLRGLQNLLGDWHDREVLEQMMLEMVGRPAYLRENLSTAMEIEKLVLRCRADKGRFREMYFRRTLEGADYQRVKNWVEKTLGSGEQNVGH